MIEAAAKTAWATDKGMTIAIGVVTALRLAASTRSCSRSGVSGNSVLAAQPAAR